jgi:hypothetical protein
MIKIWKLYREGIKIYVTMFQTESMNFEISEDDQIHTYSVA